MKYNFTPLLTLFSAALIGGIGLSLATDTPPAAPEKAQATTSISGKYCVSAGSAVQLLAARPNDDGSLDFGLSVWFENGQQCGLMGKAQPGKNGGWRFEENMKSANEEERCGIDITTAADGKVIVNADEAASCRFACGGGAAISNLEFPPDSLENRRASSDLLSDPETLYNTACIPKP
ncbi:MAG: hypothetical protein ACXW4B_09400 [Micavibrio sp.]